FKIVYLHQSGSQLSRGTTRAVISRIMRDNANSFYGLFIVSNDAGDTWELVNARLADGKANRLILRRIPVGSGKGARTATERLALVDLDGRDKLTAQQIQELHDSAFDVEGVSKEFYKKIAAWYFWAQEHKGVVYPRNVETEADKSIFFIRLLTRLIFCWFMRQKGLIPKELFDFNFIKNNLKNADLKSGDYYKAILQNLFFATLNREIKERSFRRKNDAGMDGNYGVTTLYRYADLMSNPEAMLSIFKEVPFVNGGLFECLDDTSKKPEVRLDDFSENGKNKICLPNELFFGKEREVDLSKAFGDKKHKNDSTAGLITILNQYQFTVEENTPLDQSVALDPELLGKVFENLLASYNEETKTTARKALGAFYTPREIVEYMVDESLLAYFKVKLTDSSDAMDEKLRQLLAYNDEPHGFSDDEVNVLITAIDHLKALDPAVGSGAFPMGMLHKLVHMLGKLDPGNEKWKQKQLAKMEDIELREQAERAFRDNPADYGRKLYLIQNCIYGVDIQPVAVQIAKMRFFISLIVDQKSTADTKNNYGILALPNLETNFVAANTLIGIEKPQQQVLRNPDIEKKESELHRVRQQHFTAKTPKTKAKYREKDEKLRTEIAILLKHEGWGDKTAEKLAQWNPYDQNATSEFFDPEWMFGINDGFNIVLSNPPYIDSEMMVNSGQSDLRDYLSENYKYTRGNWDIYIAFFEKAFNLAKHQATISYITPDKWLTKPFGEIFRTDTLKY
ncbi:MAG TPA: Eco57I restriction-modification methylase domain-containing protein, partial [Smithellaceae bacterium]|nr:Eco57I restriction-modification methylase domain-containing protein [Smithellaceae bacterium]